MTEPEYYRGSDPQTEWRAARGGTTPPTEVTFREFIAPLMEQNARDLAFTTNSLIDSLAMSDAEQSAIIATIREDMEELLNGPYMPMPREILAVLYPSHERWEPRAMYILAQRRIHSSTHGEE